MNKPLLTLAASIFDNVNDLLKQAFADDPALVTLTERNATTKEKLENYKIEEAKFAAEATTNAHKIEELRDQIKDLDTARRVAVGQAKAYRFRIKTSERQMKDLTVRIDRRQDAVLRKMIDKKVNAIGKKVVSNIGWRARKDPANAGGVSLVDDDGKLPGGRRNPDSLVNQPGMDNIMTRHLEDGGSPAG